MGYKIIDSQRDYHVYTYMVDSEADLTDIPSNVEGSAAISLETGKVYMLNTKGE